MIDENVLDPNSLELNVTKVLAAILKRYGAMEVTAEDLLDDYNGYDLAVSIHDESSTLVFEMVKKVNNES